MTQQPQPKNDWVAIIKGNIEADGEYRQAVTFRNNVNVGVRHFESFFKSLEDKDARGEYVDPKAFEKEVLAYPTKISAPIIATIMSEAMFERFALQSLAKKLQGQPPQN